MGVKQLAAIVAVVFLIAVAMAFIGDNLGEWISDIWDAVWNYIQAFLA